VLAVQRAAAIAADLLRRLLAVIRRHPVRAALALPALLLAYLLALIPLTPGIDDLRKAKSEGPSVVMSADGAVLAEYKRVNRQWVRLRDVSPHVIDALIATEDRRFYQHHGIDFRRVAAALVSTLHRAAPPSRSSWRATCTRRRSAAPPPSGARPVRPSRR
jgi:penicillin-binding protein 1A